MPLYLVRWPNLSCSLVRAHDKSEVHEILDELDNPDGVQVTRYDGPVFLDFELATDRPNPVQGLAGASDRPSGSGDIELGDTSRIADGEKPRARIPDVGTGTEMYHEMLRVAFPNLYRVLVETDSASDEAVEAAVREEALNLAKYSWRIRHRAKSSNPDDRIAHLVGTSPEVLTAWRRERQRIEDDGDDA